MESPSQIILPYIEQSANIVYNEASHLLVNCTFLTNKSTILSYPILSYSILSYPILSYHISRLIYHAAYQQLHVDPIHVVGLYVSIRK